MLPQDGLFGQALNIKKLFAGRIDFIVDNPLLIAWSLKEKGYRVDEVEQALSIEHPTAAVYFGFNKHTDDQVIQQLQQALDTLKQEGGYDMIFKKYLP